MISNETIQTILQILGGCLSGFLIAKYSLNKQKKTKTIYYETNRFELLRTHDAAPKEIKITIKTDDANDTNHEIKNAHAHNIRFKNKGNSIAKNFHASIKFRNKSHILSYSISPEPTKSYNLEAEIDSSHGNILQLINVPYLNPGHELSIAVITTGDEDISDVEIAGNGEGVEFKEFKGAGKGVLPVFIFLIFAFLLTVMFDSSNIQTMGSYIPEKFITIFGGEITHIDVQVVKFPKLIRNVTLTSVGLILVWSIFNWFKKEKF